MKFKYLILLFVLTIFSCKNNSKSTENGKDVTTKDTKVLLHKIAKASGLDRWKNVKEIDFTFNADFSGKTVKRSWMWWPQSGIVSRKDKENGIKYKRSSEMDSLEIKTDKAFINDKYWLLFPFQLVWDKGFTAKVNADATAPISGKKMKEVTITYNDKAGYTPADMYKIYVDKENMIREWEYHPKGSKEPRMITTWEDYKKFDGLILSTVHATKDGSSKLYFTDIKVN